MRDILQYTPQGLQEAFNNNINMETLIIQMIFGLYQYYALDTWPNTRPCPQKSPWTTPSVIRLGQRPDLTIQHLPRSNTDTLAYIQQIHNER